MGRRPLTWWCLSFPLPGAAGAAPRCPGLGAGVRRGRSPPGGTSRRASPRRGLLGWGGVWARWGVPCGRKGLARPSSPGPCFYRLREGGGGPGSAL